MGTPEIVKVDLGDRSYDIVIGDGLLKDAAKYIGAIKYSNAIIVTDENIPQKFVGQVSKIDRLAGVITLPSGEKTKSFGQLEDLLNKIYGICAPDRNTLLIALGGGVIGDLTGFAASILLRGINFIQIPTTLLSQVDSSVGGKTGINNKFGKNLIGSFYQPKLVLADIDTLQTLSEREFLAGYAEVVKYGLINDAEFFDYLETNLDKIKAKDTSALKYIIAKSCKAKADIVAQDEREGGARALLNLGHTFGHALEQQMGYDGKLVHGEAVAVGMVFAFHLSHNLEFASQSDVEKVREHLTKAGLPVSTSDIASKWDAQELMKIMKHDKKVSDGKMVFILANGIGQSFIKKDIAENCIFATIESFIS
ncbi:MAG: 3-dehydroquinate synthase [Rickettsiaceae bacterium]|jgi:3-dehydroquinate synthase|nr:3-dehydroquinate synthase [Rickettsiaceae bacterium]